MATVSLDRIVEHINAAGFVSYVEQTGGGVATIYASRTADERGYPARHTVGPYNDEVVDVCVGPGWFEGPGWTNAMGDLSDLYVGPDGDSFDEGIELHQTYSVKPTDTEQTLADEVIRRLRAQP